MAVRAGDEVDSWCTRCKLTLGHRVVAVAKGVIQRVVCRTCGSEHRHRAQAPAAADEAAEASPRARAKSKGKRVPSFHARYATWQEAVKGQPASAFREYKMSATYTEGELVRHPRFGPGYVVSSAGDAKVNIMFEDGARTLAHSHASPGNSTGSKGTGG